MNFFLFCYLVLFVLFISYGFLFLPLFMVCLCLKRDAFGHKFRNSILTQKEKLVKSSPG